MYVPSPFAVDGADEARRLIRHIAFGTLISPPPPGSTPPGSTTGEMDVTVLPFALERSDDGRDVLRGHIARANPHARRLADQAGVTVLFQGAHAYVSPRWYAAAPAVPTWNYELVQVTGRARLIDDAAWLTALVDRLSATYESGHPGTPPGKPSGQPSGRQPWTLDSVPERFRDGMIRAIVGVEVSIDSLQAARKLSQNRSPADRDGVLRGLAAEGGPAGALLADRMRDLP